MHWPNFQTGTQEQLAGCERVAELEIPGVCCIHLSGLVSLISEDGIYVRLKTHRQITKFQNSNIA